MRSLGALLGIALLALSMLPLAGNGMAVEAFLDRIEASDPRGDVAVLNMDPAMAQSVDVTGVEVYYDHDAGRLVVEVETVDALPSIVVLSLELYIEGPGYGADYMVDALIGQDMGFPSTAFTLYGHPSLQGELTLVGNESVTVTIEGNKLKAMIALDEAYNPFNLEDPDYLMLRLTLGHGQGQAGVFDEVSYTWYADTGGDTGGDTGAAPSPGSQEPGYPEYTAVYRDLEGNSDAVSVSIEDDPVVRVYTVKQDTGVGYTVIEVEVEGSASNADHVAIVIETFVAGELSGQIVINSYAGSVDDDGPANGYKYYFSLPVQAGLKFEASEELTPVNNWNQWRLEASYTIPAVLAPEGVSVGDIVNLVKLVEAGDVEVYVTAVAYQDDGETLYNADTKKARLLLDQQGDRDNGSQTAGGQEQQEQADTGAAEEAGDTGLPMAAVAAVAVLVIAAAAALAFRKLSL